MMADPAFQFPQTTAAGRMPMAHLQPDRSHPHEPISTLYSHSRTRTSSSSVFPNLPPQMLYQKGADVPNAFIPRRATSTGTFSTTGSGGNGPVPTRTPTIDLRRSTSSRSAVSQPTSYVALMRKQKATVWCDRAQLEDPRIVAAQRAAKIRAANEVLGGSASGRISTAGTSSLAGSNRVTSKIRHHGKAVGYSPAENFRVGVGGVPMRLSATEVEGGDSDEDAENGAMHHHRRTSSGRSSLGSRRGLTYRQSTSSGRWSSGHTPPNEQDRVDSLTNSADGTPMPARRGSQQNYFAAKSSRNSDGNTSPTSASSGERADGLGDLNAARRASNMLLKSTVTREKSTKNPDELRRRGSVDDRTMTMGAGRLYIANPDADSD